MEERVIVRIETIGNVEVTMKSELGEDGIAMDTNVLISRKYLCTISGKDRDDFINDFRILVNKYLI